MRDGRLSLSGRIDKASRFSPLIFRPLDCLLLPDLQAKTWETTSSLSHHYHRSIAFAILRPEESFLVTHIPIARPPSPNHSSSRIRPEEPSRPWLPESRSRRRPCPLRNLDPSSLSRKSEATRSRVSWCYTNEIKSRLLQR